MERPKYERKMWYDKSDTTNRIPVSPDNLNRIEDGIEEALEGCAENKEQMNLQINSLIDNINSSLVMCRRDNNGVCLYSTKKLLQEEQSFEWTDNNITMEVNTSDYVYTYCSHNIDELPFKLNLKGEQPQIVIYVSCNMIVDITKNDDKYTTKQYPNPKIYYYNEQGEQVIMAGSGQMSAVYYTDIGKTIASGSITFTISDYDAIKYITKNNSEFYIQAQYGARWDKAHPASKTIDTAISFTLKQVQCYEARREKIDNIIL